MKMILGSSMAMTLSSATHNGVAAGVGVAGAAVIVHNPVWAIKVLAVLLRFKAPFVATKTPVRRARKATARRRTRAVLAPPPAEQTTAKSADVAAQTEETETDERDDDNFTSTGGGGTPMFPAPLPQPLPGDTIDIVARDIADNGRRYAEVPFVYEPFVYAGQDQGNDDVLYDGAIMGDDGAIITLIEFVYIYKHRVSFVPEFDPIFRAAAISNQPISLVLLVRPRDIKMAQDAARTLCRTPGVKGVLVYVIHAGKTTTAELLDQESLRAVVRFEPRPKQGLWDIVTAEDARQPAKQHHK